MNSYMTEQLIKEIPSSDLSVLDQLLLLPKVEILSMPIDTLATLIIAWYWIHQIVKWNWLYWELSSVTDDEDIKLKLQEASKCIFYWAASLTAISAYWWNPNYWAPQGLAWLAALKDYLEQNHPDTYQMIKKVFPSTELTWIMALWILGVLYNSWNISFENWQSLLAPIWLSWFAVAFRMETKKVTIQPKYNFTTIPQ